MTKEEILAMEAGIELDGWVAEKVMGTRTQVRAGLIVDESEIPILAYSEDISAAWQVKQKMNSEGFWFRLADYDEKGNQQAIFEKSGYEPFVAICPEAPEAICKAALLAKLK